MNNKYEDYINQMNSYINWLNDLSLNNPLLAREIARQDLIRIGIVGEDGLLKYPYNGDDDRPRYNCQIDGVQTVTELVCDSDIKTQKRIRK